MAQRRRPNVNRDRARYREASTVEQLVEQNVEAIAELDHAARSHRTLSQRMAQAIASFCGSMTFFWLHVAWFGGWIVFNAWPGTPHVDPYPFTFLTLLVSLEAIFLSTFILISQNEETRMTERRNALDLQINLLTEQENTRVLRLLSAMARKLGIDPDADGSVAALEQATRPETLAEHIDRATGVADH
jgi:uncharacterized membrane protein